MRFPEGFCEQLCELQAVEPELGGSALKRGLQGGVATSDFTKPWVCALETLRVQVETRWVQTMKGTRRLPETSPQSYQWTGREWLCGDSKSKLMMEKMLGSSWRARSVLSSGTFPLTVSACTCMGTPCSVGLCGSQWGTGQPHLTSSSSAVSSPLLKKLW